MLSEAIKYFKKNGIKKTSAYIMLKIRGKLPSWSHIIFFVEPDQVKQDIQLPTGMDFMCIDNEADFSDQDIGRFQVLKGEHRFKKEMSNRFSKGGVLLLLKQNNIVMCFVWAFQGFSYDHFFPITEHEIYLMDGGSFPECRGKNFFPLFINYLQQNYGNGGVTRIYFAVTNWNHAMLKCTAKTEFRKFAIVKKISLFSNHILVWQKMLPKG